MRACATPSAAPAPAPTTAARAPASGGTSGAPAASAPGSSAPSAPAAAAPASAAVAQSPAQSAAPGGGPPASGLQITLVPGASEARYRSQEQFANAVSFSEAVGATSAVEGQILLDEAGKVVPNASRITVDLSTLRSDQRTRDNYLQQNTLQTAQHPTAQFVPSEVRGLPSPLPTSGEVTFQLAGDLTLRGTTRPAVWDVRAQVSGSEVTGKATTQFTLQDYGIPKPSVARVVSIEDTIILELDFRATTGPEPAAARR
jgi:polyisoprenoid-binding protein YceI